MNQLMQTEAAQAAFFIVDTIRRALARYALRVQFRRAPAGTYSENANMKKYYVVTGVWRENNIREIINGFYARRDAFEEAGCHRHTHKSIRIQIIMDTPGAFAELVHQLQTEAVYLPG